MRLLQGDRRANIEIIQANKDANRDEIKRLRDENKEIRMKIANIQRQANGEGRGGVKLRVVFVYACLRPYESTRVRLFSA